MKQTKLLLPFLLILLLFCSLSAANAATTVDSGTCGENLTWTLDSAGTLTISGSEEMLDYGLDETPWYDSRNIIKTVNIQNGVTRIGDNAFFDCTKLTSVTIPNGVTSIGDCAFADCAELKSLTIPDSVTKIGTETFFGTAWYNAQPDGLIYAGKVAYAYKGEMPDNSEITIQSGTKGIADSAFIECNGLTSVELPNSMISIGNMAFYETGLKSIMIPDSVTSIGDGAFWGCGDLSSVKLPNSLKNIEECMFFLCGLKSITIPNSVTSIGHSAFFGCSELTSVMIPDSVISIGSLAFESCDGLTSVRIPNSVKTIEVEAFCDCDALADVYYEGSESEWNAITIEEENEPLLSARIHYNSKAEEALSAENVTIYAASVEYNGKERTPSVTVKSAAGQTLKAGTDYTVTVPAGRTVPGTYVYKITGKGAYTGTVSKNFVIKPCTLKAANVTLYSAAVEYNGKVRTPKVTVKSPWGVTLTEGTHYTLTVPTGRTNAGSYTYQITGKGRFAGTVTKTFKINRQALSAANVTLYADTVTYNGKVRTPSVTVKNAAGDTLKAGTDYTVTVPAGRTNVGTYVYKVTGKGNYSGTVNAKFVIKAAD